MAYIWKFCFVSSKTNINLPVVTLLFLYNSSYHFTITH